tara:strand:+ start:1391 stop:1726 length:336 start_codon:yes stop_codon:yes gene_type:complete
MATSQNDRCLLNHNDIFTRSEKAKIVIDIINGLKKFPGKNNNTIDLYNSQYSYYDDFKKITSAWINNELSEYKGIIYFAELDKNFEYLFPKMKNEAPLFVLRCKTFIKSSI